MIMEDSKITSLFSKVGLVNHGGFRGRNRVPRSFTNFYGGKAGFQLGREYGWGCTQIALKSIMFPRIIFRLSVLLPSGIFRLFSALRSFCLMAFCFVVLRLSASARFITSIILCFLPFNIVYCLGFQNF